MEERGEVKTRTKQVTLSKGFVNLEAPVIIGRDNVEQVMNMVGGQKSLDLAYHRNRRVEFQLRPEDPTSKPVNLDRIKTNDLLVRVVRKRKKVMAGEIQPPDSYIVEVLGVIGVTYHLKSMSDFQYLPVVRGADGRYTDLSPNLNIRETENPDFLNNDMPLFIPPMNFSRIDMPTDFQMKSTVNRETKFISRTRARRSNHTIFRCYGDEVPTEPILLAAKKLSVKVISQEQMNLVKAKFEEKPIWSKSELNYVVRGFHPEKIKYILPVLAYHFQTGPWRTLWCRFGYDPIKDPNSRFHQIVDYRLRTSMMFKTSKTFDIKRGGPSTRTMDKQKGKHRKHGKYEPDCSEDFFLIKPAVIPPARQMFYQLCNIQIPEVQEKLRALKPTAECTEKHGWLPPGIDDEVRQLIYNEVRKSLDKDLKTEAGESEASGCDSGSEVDEEDEELTDEEEDSSSSEGELDDIEETNPT